MSDRKVSRSFHQILDLLAEKDLRIGQVFDNIFAHIREEGSDPFYIENDYLENYLWEYLDRYSRKIENKT